ncbi:MAG TPA: hypothetical protein VK139_05665 [Microbacteriaceae bacterium]|nr:hypothetical protein [Microbacteriaceae bacterium]
MGKLLYGSGAREVLFDDRTLAHLKVAIINKLRRSESFTMSWQHGLENGSGRSTIWVHEAIPLQFIFEGNRAPSINRTWIEHLMLTANSIGGLQVIPEPPESSNDRSSVPPVI